MDDLDSRYGVVNLNRKWHSFYDIRLPWYDEEILSDDADAIKHWSTALCSVMSLSSSSYSFRINLQGTIERRYTVMSGHGGITPGDIYVVREIKEMLGELKIEVASFPLEVPVQPVAENREDPPYETINADTPTSTRARIRQILINLHSLFIARPPSVSNDEIARQSAIDAELRAREEELRIGVKTCQQCINQHWADGTFLPALSQWHSQKVLNERLRLSRFPADAPPKIVKAGSSIKFERPNVTVEISVTPDGNSAELACTNTISNLQSRIVFGICNTLVPSEQIPGMPRGLKLKLDDAGLHIRNVDQY